MNLKLVSLQKSNQKTILFFGFIIFFILFLLIRFPLLNYHLFHNGVIDEKEGVDSAGSLLARKTLEPPGYAWGNLSFYLNALVFGLAYGTLRFLNICGLSDIASAENFAFIYLVKPHLFLFLARAVSSLLGMITCLIIFFIIKKVSKNIIWAFIAALILFVDPLSCLQSAQAVPGATMTAFALSSLYFSLNLLHKCTWKYYLLAGIFLGFAAATKYNGILITPAIFAAHFYSQRKFNDPYWKIRGVIAPCIFALLGFVISMPYSVIKFNDFFTNGVLYQLNRAQGAGMINYFQNFLVFLKQTILLNPGLVIVGILVSIYGFVKKIPLINIVSFGILPFIIVFGLSTQFHPRYIIPLYALLTINVVYFCQFLWSKNNKLRIISALVISLCVICGLTISVRNASIRSGTGTLDDAEKWINLNIKADSKILLDNWYGPVLLSKAKFNFNGKRENYYSTSLKSRLFEYLEKYRSYDVQILFNELLKYNARMYAVDYLKKNRFEYLVMSPSFYQRFLMEDNAKRKTLAGLNEVNTLKFRNFFKQFFLTDPIKLYETPQRLQDKGPIVHIYKIPQLEPGPFFDQ